MTLVDALATLSGRCAHGWHLSTQGCPACTPVAPDQGKAGAAGTTPSGVDACYPRFVAEIRAHVRPDGTVHACDLRPVLREVIPPRVLSSCYSRARRAGLLVEAGHERSDDERGRNAGRMEPFYRLGAAA